MFKLIRRLLFGRPKALGHITQIADRTPTWDEACSLTVDARDQAAAAMRDELWALSPPERMSFWLTCIALGNESDPLRRRIGRLATIAMGELLQETTEVQG